MIRRHTFNLVEILMALGVLMIGVVSLIGLFPLAAKVTADAAAETTVPIALEEVSAVIRDLATRPSTGTPTNWETWISGSAPLIPTAMPDGMLGKKTEEDLADHVRTSGNWVQVAPDDFPTLYKHRSRPGVFMLLSIRGMDLKSFSLATTTNAEEYIESRVLLLMWQSQIQRVFKEGEAATTYSKKFGVRINIKVGWPAELPEAEKRGEGADAEWVPMRKIKVTSFDLLNPDPASVTTPQASNP